MTTACWSMANVLLDMGLTDFFFPWSSIIAIDSLNFFLMLPEENKQQGSQLPTNFLTIYILISIVSLIPNGTRKAKVKSLSRVQLCDPVDHSLPGFSVHGILQARILEWVAISFSRGSSQPRDQTRIPHIAGRCFTVWATREAWHWEYWAIYLHCNYMMM